MSPVSPTFEEGIDSRIAEMFGDMRVCTVARVEKYDRARQRCQVQPLIRRGTIDETGKRKVERFPVTTNVPVAFPGVFHLEPGDIVLLIYCDFSIDRWLSGSNQEVDPGDDRRHTSSDAFAIPLLTATPRLPASQGKFAIGRSNTPVIEWDATQIRVGGIGGQRTLMADTFLQALDVFIAAMAAAVGTIPTGGAAAQAAIEAASEIFRAAMLTYVTTITRVR